MLPLPNSKTNKNTGQNWSTYSFTITNNKRGNSAFRQGSVCCLFLSALFAPLPFPGFPTGSPKSGVFKIEISKVSGSALAAEISTGPHNRLLQRQHCSSLCSQSEGHEHVANMTNALGHDFIGFSDHAWPPQYSSPSLCEQSERQCFAPGLRRTLLFSKKAQIFLRL